MNRYAKGRQIEYKAKRELEAQGYTCTRSSSSKGFWDLTAVSKDKILLIQVKSSKGKAGSYKSETKDLKELKTPRSVSKELWIWLNRTGWEKRSI